MNKTVRLTSNFLTILVCLILSLINSSCIPDTKYSPGFTDGKFESIKIGMTEKQVLDILGEPLTRWHPYQVTNFRDKRHYIGLVYSESPSGTHYHLRQINLDSGIVVEIRNYFYFD